MEVKVGENGYFCVFQRLLTSIIYRIKSINLVIFNNSNKPHKIVQINAKFHFLIPGTESLTRKSV